MGTEWSFAALMAALTELDITTYEYLEPMNFTEAEKEFVEDVSLSKPNFQYNPKHAEAARFNLVLLGELKDGVDAYVRARKWPDEAVVLCETHDAMMRKNQIVTAAAEYNAVVAERETMLAQRLRQRMLSTVPELDPKLRGLSSRFLDANRQAYGIPAATEVKAAYRAAMATVLAGIDPAVLPDAELPLYRQLLEALEVLPEKEVARTFDRVKLYQPSQEAVRKFGALMRERLAPLLALVPPDQSRFTAEEVYALVARILDGPLKGKTKFRAELRPEATTCSVNQVERRIIIPGQRTQGDFLRSELEAVVIGHEIGTHVLRGAPYEQCEIKLLSIGMPGYATFEEGIATAVEQALRGEWRPRGLDHLINIGLAWFQEKNFREVFEIATLLKFLVGSTRIAQKGNLEDGDAALSRYAHCQHLAFRQVARCFRGTGALVNLKDLSYFMGNQEAWKFIESRLDTPEQLMSDLFDTGKTDVRNPKHRGLLLRVKAGDYGTPPSAEWNPKGWILGG